MRILYVSFDDIGSEFAWAIHIREIVNGLVRRGHEVQVIAPASSNPVDLAGSFIPMRVLRSRLGRAFYHMAGSMWDILRAAAKFRPHVIYCRGIHLSMTPLLAARMSGCAYVVEVNGLLEFEMKESLMKPLVRLAHQAVLSMANRTVTVSAPIKRGLCREYGGQEDRIIVVQNGANVDRFRPLDRSRAREDLDIPPDARVITYVGSFYPHHGLDLLVQGAALLRKEHPNLLVLMVGTGSTREQLEKAVQDAGISALFRFPGPVPNEDVPTWLAAADVCAYFLKGRVTKYDDGFSIKLLEYMAAGRAVAVATEPPDVCSFVNNQGVGYAEVLTGKADEERICRLFSRLFADTDQCRVFGEAGRKIVLDYFNWDRAAGEVEAVLKSSVPG